MINAVPVPDTRSDGTFCRELGRRLWRPTTPRAMDFLGKERFAAYQTPSVSDSAEYQEPPRQPGAAARRTAMNACRQWRRRKRQRQRTYCWEDQWQAGPWSPRQSFPLFLNLAFYLLHLRKLKTFGQDVADPPSSIVITCDVNLRIVGSLSPLYQLRSLPLPWLLIRQQSTEVCQHPAVLKAGRRRP